MPLLMIRGRRQLPSPLPLMPVSYQGLISAAVTSDTTIEAIFTEALDPASANNLSNYTLDHNIQIQSIVLGAGNRSVTLTVDQIPTDLEMTLSVSNIRNLERTQTFQGLAKFYHSETINEATSTLLQKAKGDLQTYTQLWYQLNDANGIAYTVTTSLVDSVYLLDNTQILGLVEDWLASIWQFVSDRAHQGTTTPLPAACHLLSFPIDSSNTESNRNLQTGSAFHH